MSKTNSPIKGAVFGILMLAFSLPVAAQQVLTASDAVAKALQSNYNVLIAKNDSLQADAANTAGNAGMLPGISANSSGSMQGTSINQRFSNGLEVNTSGVRGNQLGASLNLGWTLFDGGKMFTLRNGLQEQVNLAGLGLRNQMEETVAGVLSAYFDLLSAKSQIVAARTALDFAEEQLLIVNRKVELGSASGQIRLQAEIDRNTARAELMTLQTKYNSLKITLNRLIGNPPETEFDVVEDESIEFSKTLEQVLDRARTNNISLLLAASNLRLQQFNERAVKAERYPTLVFNAAYNYNRTSSTAGFALFNQSTGPSAGIGISWNLFDGNHLNSRLKQQKIQTRTYQLLEEDTRLQVNASIRIAYAEYLQFLDLEKLLEENMVLANQNYRLALESLRLGDADILTVKEASRSFEQASAYLNQIKSNRRKAEVELLRLGSELIR